MCVVANRQKPGKTQTEIGQAGFMPNYKIIIPVFNPPPFFYDTLKCIRRAHGGGIGNVIVVDDGSTNGMAAHLREHFPEVKILEGDGELWWAGGMKMGMDYAISQGAEVVVWLNHDCQPEPGTIEKLAEAASVPGTGAVSAWCKTKGFEDFAVNPGFRNFKPLPISELQNSRIVEVDGVNGNCVAINAVAVTRIGLPIPSRHPHYGDGPYTWKLHCSGYKNYVRTDCRAILSRELARCIDVKSNSSVWPAGLVEKLKYHLTSRRSQSHFLYKFHDLVAFRGLPLAVMCYPFVQMRLLTGIVHGHIRFRFSSYEKNRNRILARYVGTFPGEGLGAALDELHGKI
jgi:glycosyltransferase involved in cell wall biosynthesis